MDELTALNPAPARRYRKTRHQAPRVDVRVTPDAVYLTHPEPLQAHPRNLIGLVRRSAERFGDQPFAHERPEPGADWRSITFAELAQAVARQAGALKTMGVARGDRVVILARNGIAHLEAGFAIMALGAVVVPLTPLYLAHPTGGDILQKLAAAAGARLALVDADLLAGPAASLTLGERSLALQTLADQPGEPVDLAEADAALAGEDAAKILFTSGSTGTPKPVVNTHGMLTAAAAMIDQTGAKLPEGQTEVALDWLPWHHCYGGNVNVHGMLTAGAKFYIDAGSPTPQGLPVTLANLADVGPTLLTTVPAAYGPMLGAFRADPQLAKAVLRNITRLSFGGAALAPSVIDAYQDLALETVGENIQFGSGYGMTETMGILALVYWPSDRGDLLGLPLPGVEFKLVEQEDGRYEARVRGPNIFTGYPGHDSQPFDEEGFFLTGDAVRAADPEDWSRGLVFAGRVAEDFKLANGVWVRAGALRGEALDRLGPLALDAVVVGTSRDEVGLLVLGAPGVTAEAVRERLAGMYEGRSATNAIARVSLLASPPSAAAGEVTAKGSLNVARVSQSRASEIDALYADEVCRLA